MGIDAKTVKDLVQIAKTVLEISRSEDVRDVAKELWGRATGSAKREAAEHDGAIVSRALHKLHTRTPPRLALAGLTSSGKSTLLNTLFGLPIAAAKRTADTTDCVIRVPFRSGFTIYDTPGFGGNETYENVTRAF